MPFNTILGPTKLNPGTSDTDPATYPAVTTLSDGSFAVAYQVIQVGSSESAQIVTEVFDGQGQLVQETFATPVPQSSQFDTDVTGLAGGGYALAWTEPVFNASGTFQVFQVFTDVYDNAGNHVSAPVSVDPAPATLGLTVPQVAPLSGGGYVVSWLMPDQGGGTDLMAAVFNSAGQEVVAPIDITNSPGVTESANFLTTSVVGLADGGFALTWLTKNTDVDDDVYTAIYDAQGQQVLAPLNVTHSADIDENLPQIAVLSNGNYALSWNGATGVFQDRFVYTAVFDPQGNQVAAPTQVGFGEFSHVAALTNGDYALFWDDGLDVFTAVYDSQGAQLVAPVHVTDLPSLADVAYGGITALADGAYAVTWEGQVADQSYDIFTAVYDSAGHQLVAPVNVSNSPGVDDTFESVDTQGSANGSYAITWQGPGSGSGFPAEYLAIYQFVGNQSVGNVNIVGSPDIDIDLSAIINVGGDVIVTDNGNLVTLDLHNLASVGGNFTIGNNGALLTITLPSLATVTGSVDIGNNDGATTIGLGSLTTVTGSVSIGNNSAAGSVDLGSLASAGSVDISNNDGATTIGLGSLTTVTGSVGIDNNSAAGSVDLGSLASAGSVDISNNTSATSIGLGSLTTVAGSVDLGGNTSVITIDLGALVQAGAIVIADNGVVTLNLSALVNVGGNISLTNNKSLLSIDMPELVTVSGDLDISGNTSAAVINAGSLTTVGGDLDISGNTSATVINAASLTTVGGDLDISGNTSATVINAASLTTVGGDLDISGNTSATVINAASLTTVGGDLDISGNDSASVIDASSLTTVSGNVDIDLAPDATVDAGALGPGGGSVHVIGDDGSETTVILGSLAEMEGTLTITTADGVTLTSAAGLAEIALTGTAAGNTVIGSVAAKNVITGGGGNDTATGGNNDDLFTGGGGDDTLDGRGGADTAVYSGNLADYSVVRHADGSLTLTDTRFGSPDGTDTLINVELFQFADGTHTLADILPSPVITSNGGGANAQVSIVENTAPATLVYATDPNAVGTLEFTITGGADSAKFHIDKATGALSFIAAPDFEHATDAGGNNVYDVIVQVSDGLHTDSQALAVTITNVNEAPVLANQTAGQSATAGTPFSLTLPANTFQDPDAGDHLTFEATLSNGGALPSWLAYNPLTDAFSGTPGAGDVGSFDVKVKATDTGGLSAEENFHFTVTAGSTNHAPVITSGLGGATASLIITDDTKHVTTVQANDPDISATIVYSIVGGADKNLFTIDHSTGVLSFKTMPRDGHTYDVTVAASDGSLQDTQDIKVKVANGPFEFGNTGVADSLVFEPHFGLAVVNNFDAASPTHDVLELDHALFRNADPHSSPDAILHLIEDHSFQFGHDVVIVTDTHDIIDLRGTSLHNLSANNFILK